MATIDIEEIVPHHNLMRITRPDELPLSAQEILKTRSEQHKRIIISAIKNNDITSAIDGSIAVGRCPDIFPIPINDNKEAIAKDVLQFLRTQQISDTTTVHVMLFSGTDSICFEDFPAVIPASEYTITAPDTKFISVSDAIKHAYNTLNSAPYEDIVIISGSTLGMIMIETYNSLLKRTCEMQPPLILCEILSASHGTNSVDDAIKDAGLDIRFIDTVHMVGHETMRTELEKINTLANSAHYRNNPVLDPCGAYGNMVDLQNLPAQVFTHPVVTVLKQTVDITLTSHLLSIFALRNNKMVPSTPTILPQLINNTKLSSPLNSQPLPQLVNIIYADPRGEIAYTWQDIGKAQRKYRIATQPPYNSNAKEGLHFYFNENKLFTMTQTSHLEKGYCCENICKHCPYGFPQQLEGHKLPRGRTEDDKGMLYPIPFLEPNTDLVLLNEPSTDGTISIIFAKYHK